MSVDTVKEEKDNAFSSQINIVLRLESDSVGDSYGLPTEKGRAEHSHVTKVPQPKIRLRFTKSGVGGSGKPSLTYVIKFLLPTHVNGAFRVCFEDGKRRRFLRLLCRF